MKEQEKISKVSLSTIMTGTVMVIVLFTLLGMLFIFMQMYSDSMEQNTITSSEQAVVQVKNTLADYTEDMNQIMEMIHENISAPTSNTAEFFQNLLEVRRDVMDITTYNSYGNLVECFIGDYELKEHFVKNLSYYPVDELNKIEISKPHVVSLFKNAYPWVVTMTQNVMNPDGEIIKVAMDIQFSNIANYVDDVGIGQHGYCFIMNEDGGIVYHPQQQLINSGLKAEKTEELKTYVDGTYTKSNVIYTIKSLKNSDWRIVGVSFVDEMITNKVYDMVNIMVAILAFVLLTTFLSGYLLSRTFSKPANQLATAMGEFEKDAENFNFVQVKGTSEITSLSNSFGHMVVQIQELMEKVRKEEISLRKTELKALQAQINPHFLYNTLDSIAWMCEEGRNQDAVEMTNALARLFRISISRGHELITLEKELQHAESYLKIQKFRYKNQFSYKFIVDPDCLKYLCNKITLQPIIENSIVHGLNRIDEGEITIDIKQDGEDILIKVEDNGVGMTPEQCFDLLHNDTSERRGIGIKNVNDRIRIYFGEKYGLSINSELDEGTCVTIRIPKILEEDNYEAK